VWLALGLLLAAAAGALWLRKGQAAAEEPVSSARAFAETYLEARFGPGQQTAGKARDCRDCHAPGDVFDAAEWKFLKERARLSLEEWAAAMPLAARCGACHATPHPAMLPSGSWVEASARMGGMRKLKGMAALTRREEQEALHFYLSFSRDELPKLEADGGTSEKLGAGFESSALGKSITEAGGGRPAMGRVRIVDLDGDGAMDVLACDAERGEVSWIRREGKEWREETLARVPCPASAQVVKNEAGRGWDIIVACQQAHTPTDDLTGSVVRLVNDGGMRFRPETILTKVPRVSDAQPGDFNGDGRTDFAVAAFGFVKAGEIGWLEGGSGGQFTYHRILQRTGASQVWPGDFNEDGRMDFAALFAQEHEQVSAFMNDGRGGFEEKVLFKAATPSYGLAGMELTDFDGDGDADFLLANGDNMDLPTMRPRPYHGAQWLENRGNLNFEWHDIRRMYGAYSAAAADMNRDGRMDVLVASLFNDWKDGERASLMWLENLDGGNFRPHLMARDPIGLIAATAGDLNGDGWMDAVAAGMHAFPPFERMGRLTVWMAKPQGQPSGR